MSDDLANSMKWLDDEYTYRKHKSRNKSIKGLLLGATVLIIVVLIIFMSHNYSTDVLGEMNRSSRSVLPSSGIEMTTISSSLNK